MTSKKNTVRRVVTNEDIKKYKPMVEAYIRDYVLKNWKEASSRKSAGEIPLGNTGMTINDIRQQLSAELVVALQNYNPEYRTKEGKSVKESTFVYQHLFHRIGQLMKKLTKKRYGYGMWHNRIEDVTHENGGSDDESA